MLGLRRIFDDEGARGSGLVHNNRNGRLCHAASKADRGASGSPVYRAHYAVGILDAEEGECTLFYEGINRAESILGVHVLH